jgi:DNA-binding transcriptional ArsR family regulator
MLPIFNLDFDMTKSTAEKRLARLAESGLHFCEDTPKHSRDLKELANKIARLGVAKKQSRFFKALADETRLKILSLLRAREMCVCEIMIALNLTQPTTSHHLRILEGAGLVKDLREGKWVFYKIANAELVERILSLDVQ